MSASPFSLLQGAIALLAIGCGSSSHPNDAGVLPSDATDTASATSDGGGGILTLCGDAARHCDALYACGDAERRAEEGYRFGHIDVTSCTGAMSAIFAEQCQALADGVAEGSITLDLAALAECRADMQALSCADYLARTNPLDPCMSPPIATGSSPNFGDCTWDHDCSEPGDICSSDLDGRDTGYCDVLPQRGDVCHGGRCAAGLVCGDFRCEAPDPSAGCLINDECEGDDWCDQPGNDWREDSRRVLLGTCTPPRAVGEPCDSFAACAAGLHCTNEGMFESDGFRAAGTCIVPRSAGGICYEPADCASGTCLEPVCG